MRVGVKFSRTGFAKFLSHLDLQDIFSRAVRRANLPAKYSEGFHPHMNLSFASAMAVGLETEGDYFEFQSVADFDLLRARQALNASLPDGFAISAMGILPEKVGKLMAIAVRAEYELTGLGDAFFAWLEDLLAQERYLVQKERKGKVREMDLRALIFEAEAGEKTRLLLGNFGAETLTPKFLLEQAANKIGPMEPVRVVRKEMYAKENGELKALYELFL